MGLNEKMKILLLFFLTPVAVKDISFITGVPVKTFSKIHVKCACELFCLFKGTCSILLSFKMSGMLLKPSVSTSTMALFRYTRAVVGGVASTLPAAAVRMAHPSEYEPVDLVKARRQLKDYVQVKTLVKFNV